MPDRCGPISYSDNAATMPGFSLPFRRVATRRQRIGRDATTASGRFPLAMRARRFLFATLAAPLASPLRFIASAAREARERTRQRCFFAASALRAWRHDGRHSPLARQSTRRLKCQLDAADDSTMLPPSRPSWRALYFAVYAAGQDEVTSALPTKMPLLVLMPPITRRAGMCPPASPFHGMRVSVRAK